MDIDSFFLFGILGIPAKKVLLFSFISRSSLYSEKSNLKGGLDTTKSNFFNAPFLSLWYGVKRVFE